MINKFKNIKQGFTLIEMLVAILLLTTAITGPLTIASKGITASVVAKDQVAAFNLAQDAVEYIRFKRDTNNLCLAAGSSSGICAGVTNWLSGLEGTQTSGEGGCEGTQGCILDATGNPAGNPPLNEYPVIPCGTGSGGICATQMRYNDTTQRYTYITTGSNAQLFRRHVKMTRLNSNEVQFEVRVTWCYRITTNTCVTDASRKEVIVRENLLNWQAP